MRTEPTQVVGLGLPISIIREIDALAECELLSRASWLRRAILNELAKSKPTRKAP